MSQQDDLENKYKSASNEQPSKLTDKLILQAAVDAVKAESVTDKKVEPAQNNVVKGHFSFRRWQTPISIAAAAVITVSFVSSMDPWSDAVFDQPAPELSLPEEKHQQPVTSKDEQRYRESAARSEQITQSKQRLKKTKNDAEKQKPLLSAQRESVQRGSAPGKLALKSPMPMNTQEADEKSTSLGAAQSKEIDMMDSSISEEIVASPKVELNIPEAEFIQTKAKEISILSSLNIIEQKIAANEFDVARSELDNLLKQFSLSAFSETELRRLEMIKNKLKIPSSNQ